MHSHKHLRMDDDDDTALHKKFGTRLWFTAATETEARKIPYGWRLRRIRFLVEGLRMHNESIARREREREETSQGLVCGLLVVSHKSLCCNTKSNGRIHSREFDV